MPRLFVAVWPPEEVLDKIAPFERPDIPGLRWTGRAQWHITLRFLGHVPDADPVIEALGGLSGVSRPAVSLGPVTGRFGQRVLHVPVDGLDAVATAVVRATAHLGRPPEDRPFAGHLTLARVAKGARVDLRPLTGVQVEGRWMVDEVCLVESKLSSSGARYEVVDRFTLRRPARPAAGAPL